MQALNDIWRRSAKIFAERPFLIADDRILTYARVDEMACQLAHVLRERGANKGDPVGLHLPSCPEFMVGYLACQKIGAIASSISGLYKFREVHGIVSQTEMKVIVGDRTTR